MDYVKVVFKDMPRVLFSHKHETPAYEYHHDESSPFLEITYIDVGDLYSESTSGKKGFTKAGTLCASYEKAQTTTSHGQFHRHFTVALGGQYYTKHVTLKEAATCFKQISSLPEDVYEAILPRKINDRKYTTLCRNIIESIIYERNLPKVNNLKVNTLVFSLLDTLNTYSANQIQTNRDEHFSDENYCREAINYISHHRGEKINVDIIAKELNLSVGYLSRIFKSCTGYTLVEYINDIKINTVKEILANRNATLEELATIVGINDEKYLCRLFKKQTGMTITDYKAL